jgi:hypothetical protein
MKIKNGPFFNFLDQCIADEGVWHTIMVGKLLWKCSTGILSLRKYSDISSG